jgi:hypothetical protein
MRSRRSDRPPAQRQCGVVDRCEGARKLTPQLRRLELGVCRVHRRSPGRLRDEHRLRTAPYLLVSSHHQGTTPHRGDEVTPERPVDVPRRAPLPQVHEHAVHHVFRCFATAEVLGDVAAQRLAVRRVDLPERREVSRAGARHQRALRDERFVGRPVVVGGRIGVRAHGMLLVKGEADVRVVRLTEGRIETQGARMPPSRITRPNRYHRLRRRILGPCPLRPSRATRSRTG